MTSQDSTASGDYFDSMFLEDKLKRIEFLENKLDHAAGTVAQQSARIELCENYSSFFLGNPSFALKSNLHDRLWRHCFYQKIGADRKEIARRKRKKTGPSVAETVANYQSFLNDAVVLYNFLIERYACAIAPTPFMETASQGSQSFDLDELTDEGKTAVITILHKFEIYLGDLLRYQEKNNIAAVHYERAALLAPGQGNPYNQMAVLEQLKESSCNALYWYARSIKASSRSFETSVANVERLYHSNRKWLVDHSTLVEDRAHGVPTKKAAADLARARKSAASKRFTASFVDLQYQLCSAHPTDTEKEAIMQSVDEVVSSLEGFLAVNSLGDTLLCRMVVISAYSATKCDSDLGEVLVVRFGTAFAERVGQHVDKILDSGPPPKPPSIRGLAPLLLTCDYISHLNDVDDGSLLGAAQRLFWSKVCYTANRVAELVDIFGLKDTDMKGSVPKEYKDLVGFTPFQKFIDKPDDYISIEDAKLVAPLLIDSSSKKLSQESASSPFETRVKLAKLMTIVETSSKLAQDSSGVHHFIGESEQGEIIEGDNGYLSTASIDTPVFEVSSEEDINMLVYKAPEHGAGPALLVPGALLVHKATNSTPEPSVDYLTDPMDEQKTNGQRPLPPTPHGFPPPAISPVIFPTAMPAALPMIAVPLLMPTPVVQPMAPAPTPMAPPMLLGTPTPTPASLVSPPGMRAPPGLMPPPGFAPPTHHATTAAQAPPPAWDFLSQQHTANPFFRPPASYPDTGIASSQGSSGDPNSFLDHENPAGLLDSSLLQSLWLDDSNKPLSKNPFLTEYKGNA